MYRTAEITAVKASVLKEAHPVLKKFVETYFKETKVFGIPCWIAFRDLETGVSGGGVAMSHSSNVNYFGSQNGLPESERLYDLLHEFEKDTEECFHLHTSWDDGCSGSICAED